MSKFNIIIGDFSKGLKTTGSEYELEDNESRTLTNFEIVGKGAIRKRYGSDIVSNGGSTSDGVRGLLAFYKLGTTPTKQLCIFNNAKLYTITNSVTTWTDQGSYGTDAGEQVNGVTFNNLAIFGNGNAANVVKKFDGTTLGNLGGSPAKMSIFSLHKKYIFGSGVGSAPTVVYNCTTDDPEDWSTAPAATIAIGLNDGQNVTQVLSHIDEMVVFKERSKHGITPVFNDAELTTTFRQDERVDRTDGSYAGNSVVPVLNQGIMFLGEYAFQSYGLIENYPGHRLPQNLSDPIENLVQSINRANLNKAHGIYFPKDNKYRCAVPINSTTNNIEFVYDLEFGAWSINSRPASCYEIFEDSTGDREIYWGSANEGKIFRFNKTFYDEYDATTADGVGIEAYWRSKTFYKYNSKLAYQNRFQRVAVRGLITNPCTAKLKIHVDEEVESFDITASDIDYTATATGGGVGSVATGLGAVDTIGDSTGEVAMFPFLKVVNLPTSINSGREIYLEIESTNKGEGIELHWINIEGETESDRVIKHFKP